MQIVLQVPCQSGMTEFGIRFVRLGEGEHRVRFMRGEGLCKADFHMLCQNLVEIIAPYL